MQGRGSQILERSYLTTLSVPHFAVFRLPQKQPGGGGGDMFKGLPWKYHSAVGHQR